VRSVVWLLGTVLLAGAGPAVAGAPGAVLAGTVKLAGPAPARPPLEVFKNVEVCGASVADDRLVIGPDGGVRYAVVTVDGVHGGAKPVRDVVVFLDNRGCRFVPHVQTAEVGQWLEIVNSDPILHNADARLAQETLFNVALPPEKRVRKPLARAGRIAVTCDVRHTWMSAFIDVADDPYHTTTDAYGAWEIPDVPPGRYTVRVWHELLGTQTQEVLVQPGRNDVAFTLAAPAEDPR